MLSGFSEGAAAATVLEQRIDDMYEHADRLQNMFDQFDTEPAMIEIQVKHLTFSLSLSLLDARGRNYVLTHTLLSVVLAAVTSSKELKTPRFELMLIL